MDIDRTPELLAWVFGSLFGRKVGGAWGGATCREHNCFALQERDTAACWEAWRHRTEGQLDSGVLRWGCVSSTGLRLYASGYLACFRLLSRWLGVGWVRSCGTGHMPQQRARGRIAALQQHPQRQLRQPA